MKKKTTKKTIIIISAIIVLLIGLIAGIAIYSYNEDVKRTALIEEQTIAATEQALDAITEKMKLIEGLKDSFTPEQQTTYEAIKTEVDQLTKDTSMDKIQQLGTKVYSFYSELEDSQ